MAGIAVVEKQEHGDGQSSQPEGGDYWSDIIHHLESSTSALDQEVAMYQEEATRLLEVYKSAQRLSQSLSIQHERLVKYHASMVMKGTSCSERSTPNCLGAVPEMAQFVESRPEEVAWSPLASICQEMHWERDELLPIMVKPPLEEAVPQPWGLLSAERSLIRSEPPSACQAYIIAHMSM
mmetsp:Transcript_980/g.2208  ORF Transcript_980/g.2208 Transcript_980/m.2208 type:complete len:180 (-) Transcript_980:81-620(-)